jgi:hypothetical protein
MTEAILSLQKEFATKALTYSFSTSGELEAAVVISIFWAGLET